MTPHAALRTDQRIEIVVDRADGWLVLGADLPGGARSVAPWDALRRTAGSRGPAKCIAGAEPCTVALRADVPADEGIDVVTRSREAREGLQRLAAPAMACPDTGEGPGSAADVDLAALAAEAGWPSVPRASGRLAFDLGVPGQFLQAIAEPLGAGGCRARVELARIVDAASDATGSRIDDAGRDSVGEAAHGTENDGTHSTRTAIAVLLLALAREIRFVRAGAERRDGMTHLFLDVQIESAATAAELHHALSALSVACRMAGREVHALMDPDVSRTYLAARGRAVSSTR